jgi:hypothetical protein
MKNSRCISGCLLCMTNKIKSMSAGKSTKVFMALAVLAISVFFLVPEPARADLTGTLSYIQPTGTVGPNDSVTVWLQFMLDPSSDPLYTDNSGTITSNSVLDGINLNGGSMTVGINGFPNPPYAFVWGPGPIPNQDWDSFWNQFRNLHLDGGDSFAFATATYFPLAGPVPAGTYTSTIDELAVWGPDTYVNEDGNTQAILHDIASTGGFSRTVVPVPSAILLLGSGILGLAGISRRKNS